MDCNDKKQFLSMSEPRNEIFRKTLKEVQK